MTQNSLCKSIWLSILTRVVSRGCQVICLGDVISECRVGLGLGAALKALAVLGDILPLGWRSVSKWCGWGWMPVLGELWLWVACTYACARLCVRVCACVCVYARGGGLCKGLTLSGEHGDGDAWVAELDEGPLLLLAVSCQQDVLGAHKTMHQLLVLLQVTVRTTKCQRKLQTNS